MSLLRVQRKLTARRTNQAKRLVVFTPRSMEGGVGDMNDTPLHQYCANCIHVEIPGHGGMQWRSEFWKCSNSYETDFISGEKVFSLCSKVRGGGTFCNGYEEREEGLGI